ncbi:MAG: hypothetical protein H0U38_10480 [Chloroflexia bacterium]|nr:hypothetical protein [Chloroflexia bacterium]MDQ3614387.1 hypothetical protein [Chloroflexota bacterium]
MPSPPSWRGAIATWSAAAWMVMQQFGVPAPSRVASGSRVVWIQDITSLLEERESLADGRVITIPVGERARFVDRNRDREFSREEMMRPN